MERQSSIPKETKNWALNNKNKEFQLLLQNNMWMLLGIVGIGELRTLAGRQSMRFVLYVSILALECWFVLALLVMGDGRLSERKKK